MSELTALIVIWASVGASGLCVGLVGVFLTRRRFRSTPPAYARPAEDLSHVA